MSVELVKSNNLTVGNLFSGIGGICSAFKQSGFSISWANEFDSKICQIYRYNFPQNNLIEEDIRNIKGSDLEEVDVITSGFPCQAFSIAGYRQGFEDYKGRGDLFFETCRLINDLKPKVYLLENVRGLVNHDGGKTFSEMKRFMEEDMGYSFLYKVMNSKEYANVPQTRDRVYVVGFRNDTEEGRKYTENFKFPEKKPLLVKIEDILETTKQKDMYYYDEYSKIYPLLEKTIIETNTVYQYRRKDYVRKNKSKVCPTLLSSMGTGGNKVPIIRDTYGIRKLTPKECLKFMGFPQDYKIPPYVAESHIYRGVGNSVVVDMVKNIADEISNVLSS